MKRIEDIEILRAVAITMVLIAHSTITGWYQRMFGDFGVWLGLGAGVDLFFVISGFVIARSLLAEPGAIPFWIKRAYRILPAAWLWLAIGLLGTIYFNSSGKFGYIGANLEDAAASLLQVQNIHYGYCIDATGEGCANGGVPFGIYWSLSLEEQFYLVLPLVFLLPKRLIVIGLICGVLLQLFTVRSGVAAMLRTDALMLGTLLAIWSRHPSFTKARPPFLDNAIARTATFVAFVAALCVNYTVSPYPIGTAAILSAMLVFLASYGGNYIPTGLFRPALLWIGSRSYALYLCHMSVYCAAYEAWAMHGVKPAGRIFSVTTILILLTAAELTYRLVEVPLRSRGRKMAELQAMPSVVILIHDDDSRTASAACCDLRAARSSAT